MMVLLTVVVLLCFIIRLLIRWFEIAYKNKLRSNYGITDTLLSIPYFMVFIFVLNEFKYHSYEGFVCSIFFIPIIVSGALPIFIDWRERFTKKL